MQHNKQYTVKEEEEEENEQKLEGDEENNV